MSENPGIPSAPAQAQRQTVDDKPTVIAPMFWMKSPDSDNVYPVDTAADKVNMQAMGYSIAEAPRGMPKATGVTG